MQIQVRRSTLLAGIAVLGSLLALWTVPVNAVESYGIGAIPARPNQDNPRTKSIFVYEAKPRSVTEDAVKVINNTDEQRTIQVYAVDSQHSSDGAFACAQAVDEKKDVGSWLTLQKNEIVLAPHANEEIPFTVRVPDDAETGEHNGCIAIEDTKAPTQKIGNGIVLSFRSALRVAVTVPGKIEANLAFTNLFIDEQKDKIIASPMLKNTGNVSVDAAVKMSLKTIFGSNAASAEGTFVVLNKDEARFNFELEKPFWGGWYTVNAEANYTSLRQNPDDAGQPRYIQGPSHSVFVAPHPTAVLIYSLGALIILGGAAYLLWEKRRFRLMHQATAAYIVKPGDNIQLLAEAVGTKWRKLAKLNSLKPPYSLKPGQTIRVPRRRPHKQDKVNKKQA